MTDAQTRIAARELMNSLPGSAALAGRPKKYDEAMGIIATALAARERAGYEEGYKKGKHDATHAAAVKPIPAPEEG